MEIVLIAAASVFIGVGGSLLLLHFGSKKGRKTKKQKTETTKKSGLSLPDKRFRLGVVQLHTRLPRQAADCREPVPSGSYGDYRCGAVLLYKIRCRKPEQK